jgi:ubiquinone/menaquinone biosynthesis C-methylase UbiE
VNDQELAARLSAFDDCAVGHRTARPPVFDTYAKNYREVINRSIRRSGEEYEYFIDLRVRMMRERLDRYCPYPQLWPSTILDFGCGTGVTESFMGRYFPDASLFGIDISEESIQFARMSNAAGTTYTTGDGESLPYRDQKFDVIYMNGTMHHIQAGKRFDALCELKRVLAPGGFLFLYENNPRNPLMTRAMRVNPFDAGINPIMPKELRELSLCAGFNVVETWYYFFFPRFLKALRPWEAKLERLPFGAQYCLWLTR